MAASNQDFLGTGWAFPPTFRKSLGSVEMLSGEADILSSLDILVKTSLGERVMRSDYGTPLGKLVFEPMDQTLLSYLAMSMRDAITFHEPRIVVDDLTVEQVQAEGKLNLHISFTIPALNSNRNLVLPYYLSNSTNL